MHTKWLMQKQAGVTESPRSRQSSCTTASKCSKNGVRNGPLSSSPRLLAQLSSRLAAFSGSFPHAVFSLH